MKFVQKEMGDAADASSARHSAMPEFFKLSALAVGLIVAVFVCVSLLSDFIVSRISHSAEQKLFSSFPMNGAQTSEAAGPAADIVRKMAGIPGVPPYNYNVVVLEDKNPNAFAFPGGTIGVTTGLLKALKNEDETALAFVMGHELGHFKNRDHLRGLGRGMGVAVALAVIFNGSGGSIVSKTTSAVLSRKYSRTAEEKADMYGVSLVYQAYGRSAGVEKLFEIIQKEDKTSRWAHMMATHPAPERRIAKMKRYAAKLEAGD